jgi:lysophospholipase L1-like esterase
VIDEALNGRTTDASDNQLAGTGLDGSAYLPAAITSHHPLDLVIIMLGGNDLKAAYNRTPYRIALGAGHLIDICNTIGGGPWYYVQKSESALDLSTSAQP